MPVLMTSSDKRAKDTVAGLLPFTHSITNCWVCEELFLTMFAVARPMGNVDST